jgi:Uma2 family endonuclease
MTQPKANPRARLTNADYVAMTPPENTGPRYQLINGELVEMSGAILPHQDFLLELAALLLTQVNALGIGRIVIAPYDVHIDLFNTYQPDLLFVSAQRRHLLERSGITGAPDVVVEILSDSTRRHDLNNKLPVYLNAGVKEVWVVDLDAATVAIYAGGGTDLTPVRVFTVQDTLLSEAMPGVAVELGPIFARVQATP